MATPSLDALLTAAEWLDAYDDDGTANRKQCRTVAAFLRATAARQIENQAVAEIVKRTGVPTAAARRVYRKIKADVKSGKITLAT